MVFVINCSSRQVSSNPAQLHRILLYHNVRNKHVHKYMFVWSFVTMLKMAKYTGKLLQPIFKTTLLALQWLYFFSLALPYLKKSPQSIAGITRGYGGRQVG